MVLGMGDGGGRREVKEKTEWEDVRPAEQERREGIEGTVGRESEAFRRKNREDSGREKKGMKGVGRKID